MKGSKWASKKREVSLSTIFYRQGWVYEIVWSGHRRLCASRRSSLCTAGRSHHDVVTESDRLPHWETGLPASVADVISGQELPNCIDSQELSNESCKRHPLTLVVTADIWQSGHDNRGWVHEQGSLGLGLRVEREPESPVLASPDQISELISF